MSMDQAVLATLDISVKFEALVMASRFGLSIWPLDLASRFGSSTHLLIALDYSHSIVAGGLLEMS